MRTAGRPAPSPRPRFFASAKRFRAWLEKHHADKSELLVGFHKVGSGRPSMTWHDAVDEALCFGWIDSVRRRIDDDGYSVRFTPRKPRSRWSAVNKGRFAVLVAEGRVAPAGLAAFERRAEESAGYSYERRGAKLDAASAKRLAANKKAAAFFASQAPWYRRAAAHWVTTAKRPATREKRLATLIACSATGRRVPPLSRVPAV